MRAVEILRRGEPVADQVRFTQDRVMPEPGAGEVLVRTEASALNHLDLWVGRGLPGVEVDWPFVSGSDGAGIVERVGSCADPAWVGRRVLLNAAILQEQTGRPGAASPGEDIRMIGEHLPGCHAEAFVAPATNLVEIGDLDPVVAVACGLTYLTAWRMLVTRAQVRPGRTVLVTGIGGGVALAALDLARHLGCEVLVTSRSPEKLRRARELGAAQAILDDGSDWSKEIRRLTAKRGVDVCIDSVGKATHGPCIRSLARGGVFVTCGCTTGADATTDLARVFWNQLSILGSTMGSMSEFREVVSLLRAGKIAPVVDRVVRPDQGREVYARLESGDQFGKLVMDWRPS